MTEHYRRTALVLGGGGLVGGAWMVGALDAIARETGWDPGSADYVMGTSAGAMIGTLLTTALPAWLLMAYGAGERLPMWPPAPGGPAERFAGRLEIDWSFQRPVLGSPQLLLNSLRAKRPGPAGLVACLPEGIISTDPLRAIVRRVVPSGWAAHPGLWVVATDYASGARVIFGRHDAPKADLADAVAASCAIPGFYHPVAIHGRRYIDGGMVSPANLDLIAGSDAELVICLNPMSTRRRGSFWGPTGWLASLVRGDNRRVVDRDIRGLIREGKRVMLLEPTAEDMNVMGVNYMSRRHLDRVAETAVKTTTSMLRRTGLGRRLHELPSGAMHRLRRPAGESDTWPPGLFPPVLKTA